MNRYVVLTKSDKRFFDNHSAAFSFCDSINEKPKGVFKILKHNYIGPINYWQGAGDYRAIVDLCITHGFKHKVI